MTSSLLIQLPNALGLLGMVLAGRKHRSGWVVAFTSELAWAGWGWYTRTYGILPWCAIWAGVFVVNYYRWGRNAVRT